MLLFLAASFRKCSMAGDRSRCAVTSTRDKLVHLAAIPSFSEHGDGKFKMLFLFVVDTCVTIKWFIIKL